MKHLIALLALAGALAAQTGRTVQLAWQDAVNPPAAAVGLASPSGLTITIQIALTLDPQGNLVARTVHVEAPTTKGN